MKEKELRAHLTCSMCNSKVLSGGLPLFWRVTVERFGIDMNACQRQQGLGMMLGAPLASIMGPDEDLATPVMNPKTITVCESCAVDRHMPVAALTSV